MVDGSLREGMNGVLLRFLGPGMKQVIPNIHRLKSDLGVFDDPEPHAKPPPQTEAISNASAERRSFSNISNLMSCCCDIVPNVYASILPNFPSPALFPTDNSSPTLRRPVVEGFVLQDHH